MNWLDSNSYCFSHGLEIPNSVWNNVYKVSYSQMESCYTIVLNYVICYILFKNFIYQTDCWLFAKHWNEVGFWQN